MATGNRVSLSDIRDEADERKGRAIAEFLFPFIRASGLSNNELTKMLGYKNHNNLSMARSGKAALPLNKVESMSKAVQCDKRELATVVFKTSSKESYDILHRCGLVMNDRQFRIVDTVERNLPIGDMDNDFFAALEKFVIEYAEGCQ